MSEQPTYQCKNCGLALSDEKGTSNEPCPQCGSKLRILNSQMVSIARGDSVAHMQHLSPISFMVHELAEESYEKAREVSAEGDPSKYALNTIILCPIYFDSYLYETLVYRKILTDEEYQDICNYLWNNRDNIRNEMCAESPSSTPDDPGEISAFEFKIHFFINEYLGVDYFSDFEPHIPDIRKMVELRNRIAHFKEYDVTWKNEERLRNQLTSDNAKRFLRTIEEMVAKINNTGS